MDLGKGFGFWNTIPTFFLEHDHISTGFLYILIVKGNFTGDFYVVNKIIQSVEAAEQG